MPETPNHGYNIPDQGMENWHVPINDNFEAFDGDIELREAGPPGQHGYEPTAGAKYLDTENGVIYLGNGAEWTEAFAFEESHWQPSDGFLEPADQEGIDGIDIGEVNANTLKSEDWSDAADFSTDGEVQWENAADLDAAGSITESFLSELTGGDGIDPVEIADGDTLSVAWDDAEGLDEMGDLAGEFIEALTGGEGIDPEEIADGDTLSVAWDDAEGLNEMGDLAAEFVEALTGGDGIDPEEIGDGDTLSVAWEDADDLDVNGTVEEGAGGYWEASFLSRLQPVDGYDSIAVPTLESSALAGGLTGGDEIGQLNGEGLAITDSSLTVDVDALDIDESKWQAGQDALLETDSYAGIAVGEVQADVVNANTYEQDGEEFSPRRTLVQTATPSTKEAGTEWHRLDDPGTEIWRHGHHNSWVYAITEQDGVVYSGSRDELVVAAEADNGSFVWDHSHHSDFVQAISVRKDRVYSGGDDERVVAANIDDGSHDWEHNHHDNNVRGISARDGVVYSGSWDDRVIAADASDGSFLWEHTHGNRSVYAVFQWRGTVFSGNGGGRVFAADASDGSYLWEHEHHLSDNFDSVRALFARNGVVYSGSRGADSVVAANADDGSLLWEHQHHSGTVNDIFERNGVVYSASNDNRVIAADAADGRLIWEADIDDGSTIFSITERDGVLYSASISDPVIASVSDPATYVSNGDKWLFQARLASERDGGQRG